MKKEIGLALINASHLFMNIIGVSCTITLLFTLLRVVSWQGRVVCFRNGMIDKAEIVENR